MSSFKKKCTFCNQEIQLSNDSGRWLPRNLDNTAHECKKSNQQSQPQTQTQTQQTTLTLEEIKTRLERLEAEVFEESTAKD